MPTPVISLIKSLKNAASLIDFPPPADGISFLRYNLIYGFNGSGKTTLSRLIEAVREGGFRSNLPDNCECCFGLSDGTAVTLATDPSSISIGSKIAVFNEDFVERCLTWKSGSALPIVYIGEQQAELADKIATSEAEVDKLREDDVLKAAEWSHSSKALSSFKTETARLIESELVLGRNYAAPQLKADYDQRTYAIGEKLSDQQIAERKEIINRTDIGNAISLPSFPNDFGALLSSVSECLGATVEKLTIASLERRPDALPWVKAGLELHSDERSCLFCDQELPAGRLEGLRTALGDSFNELSIKIESTTRSVDAAIERLRSYRESLPTSFANALPGYRNELEACVMKARALATAAEGVFGIWKRQLSGKARQANETVTIDRQADRCDTPKITEIGEVIADVVARHNAEVEAYADVKVRAKEALKAHHLAFSQSAYREAVAADEVASDAA